MLFLQMVSSLELRRLNLYNGAKRNATMRRRDVALATVRRCDHGDERERPCRQCCRPLLRSRGAQAQQDLLVRVSILITCEYLELLAFGVD